MDARGGFSLLELMVATCILVIVFLAVFAVWDIGWSSWETADACTIANQEARKALDCLVEDASEGGALTVADVPSDGVWRSTLTFRKPAGIAAGEIVWSPDTTRYALSGTGGTQLVKTSGTDVRIVANSIQSFGVRRTAASPDVLELSVIAQPTARRAPRVDTRLAFKVKMRN